MTTTRGCVGTLDRTVRVIVGAGLLALAASGGVGAWAYATAVAGAIGLATGIIGRCPLYRLAGIKTCREDA